MTKKELEAAVAILMAEKTGAVGGVVVRAAEKVTFLRGVNAKGKAVYSEIHRIRVSPSLSVVASYKLGFGGSCKVERTEADGRIVHTPMGRSLVKLQEYGNIGLDATLTAALIKVSTHGESIMGAQWGESNR